jgi:hypothetical protein
MNLRCSFCGKVLDTYNFYFPFKDRNNSSSFCCSHCFSNVVDIVTFISIELNKNN